MESSQTIIDYLKSNNLDKFSYTILILNNSVEEIVNQIQKKISIKNQWIVLKRKILMIDYIH